MIQDFGLDFEARIWISMIWSGFGLDYNSWLWVLRLDLDFKTLVWIQERIWFQVLGMISRIPSGFQE